MTIRAGVGGGDYDNRGFYTWLSDRKAKGFTVAMTQLIWRSDRNEGGYAFPDNSGDAAHGNGSFARLSAGYFQSVDTPENAAFIETWQDFIGNPERVTNDPMEAHYIGSNMWVQAVEKAGTIAISNVMAVGKGDKPVRREKIDRELGAKEKARLAKRKAAAR